MAWNIGASQTGGWDIGASQTTPAAPSGLVYPVVSNKGIHSLIFGGQILTSIVFMLNIFRGGK